MKRSITCIGAVSLCAFLLLGGGNVNAQKKGGDGPPGGPAKNNSRILDLFKSVVAKPTLSTVSVQIGGKPVALGVIVDTKGYILTKDSELRGDNIIVKMKDGKEFPAQKISSNDSWDLAMLKVDAKDLTPVTWSTSKVAPVGNWLATVGITDKPVAIGVVSVGARALPGSKILLPKDLNNRGYLGIQMEDSDKADGVKIVVVTPKSPAEKAGLKPDDIVISVNDAPTLDRETLQATIGRQKAGDTVSIRFRRGDKEEEVKATLEKRPASLGFDRGDMQNSMGTDRSERRTGFPMAIQHDTDLKAAQCGGPLVDIEGRVIGVNIARGGRTDTYAIPAESIIPLLADLMAGKSTGVFKLPGSALIERIKAAEAVLKVAETEKIGAEKKFAEAKAALDKLLAEQKKEPKK